MRKISPHFSSTSYITSLLAILFSLSRHNKTKTVERPNKKSIILKNVLVLYFLLLFFPCNFPSTFSRWVKLNMAWFYPNVLYLLQSCVFRSPTLFKLKSLLT